MIATLSPVQLTLVEASAELAGYARCLRLECEEDDAPPDDFRVLLAQNLKRISMTLFETVDQVEEGQ